MVMGPCLVAVIFVALACNDDDNGGPSLRDTLAPDPTATDLPSGALTGIPELDSVLGALFSGDEESVRALLRYEQVPCVTEIPVDPGRPAFCRGDEPEGTLVEAFAEANCHGSHLRPEDTDDIVETLARPGAHLRAVAQGSPSWPPGDYVAVYDHASFSTRTDAAFAVIISSGAIVGVHAACGMTADGFLEFQQLDDLLLNNPETT